MSMRDSGTLVFLLYTLALTTIALLVVTFLYQYLAALGSPEKVLAAFGQDRLLAALGLSISSAFVTAFFAILLGVPAGYLLAVGSFPGKSVIETLIIDVPQTFPPIAEGMIFLLMLGPGSPLGINLAYTFAALVIAKFFVSAPFLVSMTARRFREIEKSGITLTARSLGANPSQVFTTVFLPLSLTEIAAGSALCWARAMGELGGSLVFAGVLPFKTEVIPTFIAQNAATLTTESLAASILVTTASLLALLTFKRLVR